LGQEFYVARREAHAVFEGTAFFWDANIHFIQDSSLEFLAVYHGRSIRNIANL
jgi:hypothetical protein